MVDATTTVLALVKQTIGGNRNTWGNILNTNFDYIEEALCGRHAVSTTGGSTTLTQAQARKKFIDVTGALVSDATIVVPNASKDWIIVNGTSGDFAVLVTSGGIATSVPAGTSKGVFCDGSNGVYREDRAEIGQMAFFANSLAVPNGWLECDGSTKSRTGRGYDLFGKISTTWGAGNGSTTFTLPDSYTAGKFLRGRSASVAIGVAQTDQNKAHTHSGSTASTTLTMTGTATAGGAHTPTTSSVGTESADHTHNVTTGTVTINYQPGGSSSGSLLTAGSGSTFATGGKSATHNHTVTMNAVGTHTHSVDFTGSSAGTTLSIASDGGTEVRVTNLTALLCIKY